MKIIQKLFMHSLPHEIFMPCQIFVPSAIIPHDVLIHIFVSRWLLRGGVQEKVAHVATASDDFEGLILLFKGH